MLNAAEDSPPAALHMSNSAIAQSLRELATGQAHRSKAARLRDVLPDVEAASSAGVPRSQIVKVLAANGLEISEKSLGVMLSRIRKMQKLNKAESLASQIRRTETKPDAVPPSDDQKSDIQEIAQAMDKSYDPASLKKVVQNKPSIDHYARLHRKNKGK